MPLAYFRCPSFLLTDGNGKKVLISEIQSCIMYEVVVMDLKRRIFMQEKVIVAVDAMGGDNAPAEIVKGVVDAVSQSENVIVKLVGQENVVSEELKKYTYRESAIEIVNATEVIETGEPPVMAIRRKKDSSIVVGLNLVKKGEIGRAHV